VSEVTKFSLNVEEVTKLRDFVTYGAPYAPRLSLGLVFRLLQMREESGEDHEVLREIDALKGLVPPSSTKEPEQFRRSLYPFWHKHFSTPRHLIRNSGERWGLENGGNQEYRAMIDKARADYRDRPNLRDKFIAYQILMRGLEDRVAAKRMTGDWIIFAKHNGQNFYLDLASHEEAQNPDQLRRKLRHGGACDFPFLFE
jgi:hypothetical protein